MTLNGVMAVTLRYFTEFDKHTFRHITAASICGGIYARVYCILLYVYDVVVKKFTFAISSPDEFLVSCSCTMMWSLFITLSAHSTVFVWFFCVHFLSNCCNWYCMKQCVWFIVIVMLIFFQNLGAHIVTVITRTLRKFLDHIFLASVIEECASATVRPAVVH